MLQIERIYKEHRYSLRFASGQREDDKERRKYDLISKYNQPITKLQ